MSPYLDQLASTIRATRIVRGDVYWFGRRLTRPLPVPFARVAAGADRDCRVTALQDRLYADFYCTGHAAPQEARSGRASATRTAHWVAELSDANAGAGHVDSGWEMRTAPGPVLRIARGGIELLAHRHECVFPSDAASVAGCRVGVRHPKELTARLPGFYVACGDRPLSAADARELVRIYWNVTPRGAVQLVRLATSLLNADEIPFQLKVLAELDDTSRADRAVLYFPRAAYPRAIALVARVYPEVAPDLRGAVPALTKALAPGVALAEDPGGGVSFGEHRCRSLAAALIDTYDGADTSPAARLERLTESLAANGISVERPYLMAGPDDNYVSSLAAAPLVTPAPGTRRTPADTAPDDWMIVSERIADRICRDAAWSGDQCNWLGAGSTNHSALVYGSLGPQLYAGTSGVALFLAELASVTGELAPRRTARGAIRCALSRAEAIDADERHGLFTGWIGIALAAARIGQLTGDASLLSDAASLFARVEPPDSDRCSPDVISGAAGAIVGLLASQPLIGDRALHLALDLGNGLLASATQTRAGWSWRSPDRRGEMHLTGLSHGAAGIGWALLELYRACGDRRYRNAADMAFAYERTWFDDAVRNWRDLRGYPVRGTRRDDPVPCSSYWCHGAPGIALSRLRAFQITGDARYKAEAIAALDTTAAVTRHAVDARLNFSLCHGVAGNADVLLAGAAIFDTELGEAAAIATAVAASGIERYSADERWPSGAGASTPALMIGLAGVGHFYLRLARPATPSVLLLDVDAFVGGHVHAAELAAAR